MMSEGALLQLAKWKADVLLVTLVKRKQVTLSYKHLLVEHQVEMLGAVADYDVERLKFLLDGLQVLLSHGESA